MFGLLCRFASMCALVCYAHSAYSLIISSGALSFCILLDTSMFSLICDSQTGRLDADCKPCSCCGTNLRCYSCISMLFQVLPVDMCGVPVLLGLVTFVSPSSTMTHACQWSLVCHQQIVSALMFLLVLSDTVYTVHCDNL
jgi:hypothetical protein